MQSSLFFLTALTLALFCSSAKALSEQEAAALGCIKCSPAPICNCPAGQECEIRERTCGKCQKIVCRPARGAPTESALPNGSATIVGEVNTVPPTVAPTVPLPLPIPAPVPVPATVFSSTTCVFPSTVPVESTVMQTIVGQVPQTFSQIHTGTIVQTVYSTSIVPIEVVGTVVMVPTVYTTVCQTSIALVPSTIAVPVQTTVLSTLPLTVVGSVRETSQVEKTACISTTFSQVLTSTIGATSAMPSATLSEMPSATVSEAGQIESVMPAGETMVPKIRREHKKRRPVYYF